MKRLSLLALFPLLVLVLPAPAPPPPVYKWQSRVTRRYQG